VRLVIDGLSVVEGSNAVVVEHLLQAWTKRYPHDELHLVLTPEATFVVPKAVTVHRVGLGRRRYLGRMRAQATVVPRLCRVVGADVMLGAIPSTTINRLPCPRAVIAWDLRHELRPAQFTTKARLLRKVSYDIGFRQADAIITISERTRGDLLRSRPWLADRVVRAAQLGSSDPPPEPCWPPMSPGGASATTWSCCRG
jgi:hypothetical protein